MASGGMQWTGSYGGWRIGSRAGSRDPDAGAGEASTAAGGLGAWLAARLLERLRGRRRVEPRLTLVERIHLAPRQSLALIEAEGRRILVATSPEGGPAFYPLDTGSAAGTARKAPRALDGRTRASW